MNHLSLFSGIGGFDLAADWVGFVTVGQCEKDEFCLKVLNKHWPHVPKWTDIRDLTLDSFLERWQGGKKVDLITGGFPCQPYSKAGNKRGSDDDRHLWPQMYRVIQEFKPTWIVGENVSNIANMELDNMVADLEKESYEVQPIIIPACGVEAPHYRPRCFILAHLDREGCHHGRSGGTGESEGLLRWQYSECEILASALSSGIRGRSNWTIEPDVGRMADGISNQLDRRRLSALGRAVVPQQVYPILKAIMLLERRG